jgi:hypothetical protein
VENNIHFYDTNNHRIIFALIVFLILFHRIGDEARPQFTLHVHSRFSTIIFALKVLLVYVLTAKVFHNLTFPFNSYDN